MTDTRLTKDELDALAQRLGGRIQLNTDSTASSGSVSAPIPTPSQASRPMIPSATDAVDTLKSSAQSIADTGVMMGQGMLSNVAGLASMPYEIPALVEFGYNYLTGDQEGMQDPNLPLGAGYDFMSKYLVGDLNKVENFEDRPMWERGAYYAGENVSGLQRLLLNSAQGVAGGLASEQNVAAGVGIQALPTGRRGTPKVTKAEKQSPTAKYLGEQLTNETGIQETRGMQLYREALQLEDGSQDQLNLLAKAKEQLALEELGRQTPEGIGSYNLTSWAYQDLKRQQALEDTLMRLAGAEGGVNPAKVREGVANAFNAWEKSRINDFKNRNRADFESIPKGVYFDVGPVLAKFDAIADKYGAVIPDADDMTKTRAIAARAAIEKITARFFDSNGNMRDLTAQEIQDTLSELGDVAWKGTGPGFEDLTPGVAKAMAREVIHSFDAVLDNPKLTADQLDAADALRTARANFATRVNDMRIESDRVFMKFGIDGLDSATPEQLLNKLKAIAQDTSTDNTKGQIEIVSSLVQQYDPQLWSQVKGLVFEDAFSNLRDQKGNIDFQKLQQASRDLQKNMLLFGDRGQINQFKGFLNQLEGIFARYDKDIMNFAEVVDFYRAGKTGAEALGSAFGPKGRYLGELAVKVGQLLRKGKFDPRMAAYLANTPDAQIALTKSLKGEFKDLNTAQIRALQALAVYGKIYTKVGIPAVYIGRDENPDAYGR